MEYAGFIASLYLRNTGNGYDRVAQVRDIDLKITSDPIDASHRDSGSWGSKLPGTKSGELSFDLVFDFTLHDRLIQLVDRSESERWLISWNDASEAVWEVYGGLSEMSPSAPYQDALTASCTVQMQGRPEYKHKSDYPFDLK